MPPISGWIGRPDASHSGAGARSHPRLPSPFLPLWLLLSLLGLGVGGCFPIPTGRVAVNAQGQLVLALDAQGRYSLLPQEGAHLYLWDPESGSLRQLTQGTGVVGFPQWAPDGRRLLYVSWEEGGEGEIVSTLWLLDVDPQTPRTRPLLRRRGLLWNPQVSPDGQRVAFRLAAGLQTPSFELEIVDVDVGVGVETASEPQRRGSVLAHRWRPDGSLVVWTWTARAPTRSDGHPRGHQVEVALLDPRRPEGPEIPLLSFVLPEDWAEGYPYLEWLLWDLSPDGRMLLLTLADTPIAYPGADGVPMALYAAEVRGARVERVVKLAERAGYPAFSPSGRKIAYVAVAVAEGEGAVGAALVVLDRDVGEARRVTPRPGRYLYPFWVGEGRLGVVEQKGEGNEFTIWMADLASGSLVNLTERLRAAIRAASP